MIFISAAEQLLKHTQNHTNKYIIKCILLYCCRISFIKKII